MPTARKRVAAIVLPRLACELARRREPREAPVGPSGVIVTEVAEGAGPDALAARSLGAVNEQAWRYGVRPGQSVAEATSFVGGLRIACITRAEIEQALGQVADVALGFGTTAATGLALSESPTGSGATGARPSAVRYPGGGAAGPADTVWLDTTGCARLVGGEDLLADDLRERVKELGHAARVAIADGPRIAQAVARWGRGELVVPAGQGGRVLGELPIAALPMAPELLGWLGKLGIMRVSDLARIERAKLASRLGPRAQDLLALLVGQDDVPLLHYVPTRHIVEETSFEDEIEGTEPLLFAVGSLTSRASLRLQSRGEATDHLVVELDYDRSVARLRGIEQTVARLELELPVPLSAADELLRTVRAKLERLELGAPVRAVRLTLDRLRPAVHRQLELSRQASASQHGLPTLLAELSAWLGPGQVGVLRASDSLRPEARSELVPAVLQLSTGPPGLAPSADLGSSGAHGASSAPARWLRAPVPTRLLARPLYVGKLESGGLVTAEPGSFVLERLELDVRLDGVEWWTSAPIHRDYARASLHFGDRRAAGLERGEAWVYVDRTSGRGFVHGWFE